MSLPKSWTRVSERAPLDLEIFTLRQFEAADPRTGKAHPRVVLDGPDWVNVIPVTTSGEIVLVRQFRFGIWALSLEIPGGLVDEGEAPEHAAARELEEETGYRPARLIPLGWCHPNAAIQNNKLHTFLAEGCEQVHGGRPDAQEDLAVELYPRAEVDKLLREGGITHAAVIAAFFFERLRAKG